MSSAAISENSRFVGRVNERKTLEKAWSASVEGETKKALVWGEPGIGKTLLCTRIVKKAVIHGARTMMATGYPVQRNLPYGILGQLLNHARESGLLQGASRRWLDVLETISPALPPLERGRTDTTLPGDAKPNRIAAGMQHVVATVASETPIIVFVDDVHWSDATSMDVLHYLAHSSGDMRVFYLLASRSNANEIISRGRWEVDALLHLHGLNDSETLQLLHHPRKRSLPPSDIRAIQRVAHGNPLLINALATRSATGVEDLPPTARQYFRDQVSRLSSCAQRLGAALTTVGQPLTVGDLAWMTETHDQEMDSGLEELIDQGYVRLDSRYGVFNFVHDIVGNAFIADLPPAESAKLHGRAAKLLRDEGQPAAVVATQLTVAGDQEETCTYALQAARASSQLYAYREAENFFRIAIRSSPSVEIQLECRIALSTILLRRGRRRDAESILEGFPGSERLTKHQSALIEAHLLIARLSEAGPPAVPESAFKKALELESLLPPEVATRLFSDIASNAQQGLHDLAERAIRAALRPLSLMEDRPERIRQEVIISSVEALNTFTHGNLDRLDDLTRQGSAWPSTFAACLSAGGLVRISQGLMEEAERSFLEALEVCEQYGFLDQRLSVMNNLGVCFLEQGRWDEAEIQFREVAYAGRSVAPKEVPSALTNLLILEYERGDYEAVVEAGNRYLREAALQSRLRGGALGVLGLAQLKLGRLGKAGDTEKSIRGDSSPDAGWSSDISYLEIFLARRAVIKGNVAEAKRRLEEQVDRFWNRDFYCAARMKVELISIHVVDDPLFARQRAVELRPTLAAAQASPLAVRLDAIMARCETRLPS